MNRPDNLKFIISDFLNKEYFKAYDRLYKYQKKNLNDTEIVNMYLTVFALAAGIDNVADYYLSKLRYSDFERFLNLSENSEIKKILITNSNEHKIWNNYLRARNQSEVDRFGVTAPLCKGDVLEVGCANGDLSTAIAMHADNLYGVDVEPIAIELARWKANNYGINNCHFMIGDGAKLAFPDNSFDTVVLAEILEHVSNPKPFIKEAIRVCKSGGRILISVPNGYQIPDIDHVRIFTRKTLEELVKDVTISDFNWINTVPEQWLFGYLEINKSEVTINDIPNDCFLPIHQIPILDTSEKVSVIIPTFNRGIYIKDSLDSVLNQTYSNTEIIVVNDGSEDNTREIIQKYKHDIIYIEKENGGKSSAINKGLERATGDYIWIFDDDDIALPKKLELQIRRFQQDKMLGLVHTSAIYFKDNSKEDLVYTGMWKTSNISQKNALKMQLKGNHFFTPSVIVRTECYKNIGEWDPDLIRAQDYDMWTRISRKYKTSCIPVPTIHYRMHTGMRGTNKETIKLEELQDKTKIYHRLVVKKLSFIPIEEIFPVIKENNNVSVEIESLIERALIMAANNLTKECIIDIKKAKRIAIKSQPELINFSDNGIKLISQLIDTLYEMGESKAIVLVLFFVNMIKDANK